MNNTGKPSSPIIGGRRRSPSPRAFLKRSQSPNIDGTHNDENMNRVKKQVPKVLKARLYLLQQPGPNSFLIGGDSPDHKYKVIIGPQSCTCAKEPFCIHILFVMLRVFQVKETDPLLWSRELKNFEVETLFRKYHKRVEVLSKKKLNRQPTLSVKSKLHEALPDPLVAGGHSSHSLSLGKEDEEVCPICLSDLVDGESMTVCHEGCQNHLHHHCMAVWAEECRRRKEPLNCPLCRTVWQSRRSHSPRNNSDVGTNNALHMQQEDSGLPSGQVIPEDQEERAEPWTQVFGVNAIACLFSRDWKHRESGLRYVSRKAVKILQERRTTVSYVETKFELLGVCSSILSYIIRDRVYSVYLAALRAFRAIITNVKYNSVDERKTYHQIIKTVIEEILLKCCDSNRRVSIISMKVLIEFVSGDSSPSGAATTQTPPPPPTTTTIPSPPRITSPAPSQASQYNMELIFCCLQREPHPQLYGHWQWWLGRLSFIKRLFQEHHSMLVLGSETRINMASSLPVSPNSDIDLREFLNSLGENVNAGALFTSKTTQRLCALGEFASAALSCSHTKVHKDALSLLVKCISISSQDTNVYPLIKQIVYGLTSKHQSTLHRHLSSESQREQEDIMNILGEHREGAEATEVNGAINIQATPPTCEAAGDGTLLTPPSSPLPAEERPSSSRPSPPNSSYDPGMKCVRQVEDDEAEAIALALNKSIQAPERVIPDQLVPIDDLTLVHIQPGGDGTTDGEVCHRRNVYLENVHWKKGCILGTGAFSSCFEAMDYKTGRIMAVKQISFVRNTKEEQDKVHQVVLEEIALLHKLKHPNIVACLGATQHEAHYNLFMELMSGGSIARLLSMFGAFRESVTKSYTYQIIQAVAYLHQNHTLHRDLKGANILVDSTGQIVKLSDFGTAARLMAHGTGTKEFCGQLLGTIPFMSPEVLRGEHYGRKCDVWSIGCCIIEMASGCPPWGAQTIDNHLALMFKIASSTTGPSIPSSLGPALRDLTLRCLELKEGDRPPASELLKHAVFRT